MSLSSACPRQTDQNRLLAVMSPSHRDQLEPHLECVSLLLHQVLIEAHEPIEYVYFPITGIVSTVAQTKEGRIEIGLVGREGLIGIPVILGASQCPHTSFVQGKGEAFRISADKLRMVLLAQPLIARLFSLYVQAVIVQMGQSSYANLSLNIEARLARWILMTHDRTDGDSLMLTHEFLAAMLGARRSSVTIATHVLEGAGLIQNRRGRIIVRDRERLTELAGDTYQVAEDEYERLMAEV